MIEGDVVFILVGDYKGGNGIVLQIRKDKVLVVVDPFGKKLWFKKGELK